MSRRLRILLNLRTAALALALLAVAAAPAMLVWANHTGLPDQWRRAIEREMAKQGTIARIGSLRYSPIRGVIARDVQVFSPERPDVPAAHLEQIVVGLDRTKMLRGIVRIERIELSDARVVLPTAAGAPELVIEHLDGRMLISAGRVIEVREARGMIGGVALDLGARLLGHRPRFSEAPPEPPQDPQHRLLLARIAREIGRWQFDPSRPPRIRLFLEGELDDPGAMRADLGISARNLGQGGYQLARIDARGEIVGGLLSIDSLHASDQAGTLAGRLDFDLNRRNGRFSATSSLDAARLLHAFFGIRTPDDLAFAKPPSVEVDGTLELPPDAAPQWRVVGTAASGPFGFRGSSFDGLKTSFATDGRAFYLRDVELLHRNGTARGKVLGHDGLLRYQVSADVPVDPWRPFFAGKPFGKVLDKIEARQGHQVEVDLEGSSDLSPSPSGLYAKRNWSCAGTVHATGFRYSGVPLHEFAAQLSLNQLEYRFDRPRAVFDDRSYPLRRGPPGRLAAQADNVTIDRTAELVRVDRLTGVFWPGQLAAMFNPDLGTRLTGYRFHAPPETASSGVIDLRPDATRTDFRTAVTGRGTAEYPFAGTDVPVDQPRANVHVRGRHVDVNDLQLETLGGRLSGRLTVTQPTGATTGEFHWSHLALPVIAETWRFEQQGGGLLTGRLAFSTPTSRLADLDGEGSLALTDGELFAVPIFGPLSPIISSVLGNERAGFEHARDAFCTFRLQHGILTTSDFFTETPSVVFAGDGTVNLATRTLDLTMLLDARGLLGVITLPLRPFPGLFQFRGTGPLNRPEWRNVMFTAPDREPAARRPPRARPVPEPPDTAPAPPKAIPVAPDPGPPAAPATPAARPPATRSRGRP